jgi:hypothetical protein
VSGALLLLMAGYLFAEGALPLFQAGDLPARVESCTGFVKGRLGCELGNLLEWLVPASMRGVVGGVSGLLMAAMLAFIAWLLVKPLLQRKPPR